MLVDAVIIDSASAGLKTDHNPCQVRGGNAEELDALHSDRGFVACRVHPGRSCPLPHPGGLQTPPSGPHLPCPFPRALPHHMTKLTLESWQRQPTGQDCRSSSRMSRCAAFIDPYQPCSPEVEVIPSSCRKFVQPFILACTNACVDQENAEAISDCVHRLSCTVSSLLACLQSQNSVTQPPSTTLTAQ